jgi:hypothetical protein
MPRSMVGLLAAVGAAMSALVGLSHGDLVWVMVADAAAATGLAAYLALPSTKKTLAPCVDAGADARARRDLRA